MTPGQKKTFGTQIQVVSWEALLLYSVLFKSTMNKKNAADLASRIQISKLPGMD